MNTTTQNNERGVPAVPLQIELRDWFAGQALNGLLASGKWHNDGNGFDNFIAIHAHNIADAMLAERSKP